jgi:ankyrin repeat protein
MKALLTLIDLIKEENVDKIKLRIADSEFEVDAPIDTYGFNALHWAAICGNLDIAQLLIEKCSASINATNNFGETPLHWAA